MTVNHDGNLDFELRKRAVADLDRAALELYHDMALGGRLCRAFDMLGKPDGRKIAKEKYWTEPDGRKRHPKTASTLIASGALVPQADGLLDDMTSQSFMRYRRL
jgi:hypothetical protein